MASSDPFIVVRIMFVCALLVVLAAGGYLMANFNRFFGVDPNMPSESESARVYTRTEAMLVWASAVKVLAIGAFFF